MTCIYCGNRNNDEELRCRRCGRKPDDTLNGEFVLRRDGALAAQLQRVSSVQVAERVAPNLANARQRRLAFDQPVSNVIPIEQFAPPPRPRSKPAPRKPAQRHRVPEEQGTLDFLPPAADKPRTLGTTVEAVIFCEDPVASMLHRAVAAALDWSMVLIGYGLFLGVFSLSGGEFDLNPTNLMLFGAMLPILTFTYGLLWAIAGRETPGMQWTHLHLTTFEGFEPDRKQLLTRFLGSCLSLSTVLGLLWPFVDEENLGWQDHMSRTFPTPGLKSDRFLRR
ncbi:RDD domain containing protein [Candidatus Sulfopaludibacter sp. SbA4]|nr:RDD domain containing protein [Candidatus Sulfopaludibacter sp. SbA4]